MCSLFDQGVKMKGYSNNCQPLRPHLPAHSHLSCSILWRCFQMSSLFDQGVRLKGYSNAPVFAASPPSSTSALSSLSLSACKAAFKCRLCLIRVWSWRATATSLYLPASPHLIYLHTLISLALFCDAVSKSLFDQGVKLKGYSNEPVFASLSALIYQHTLSLSAFNTAFKCRLCVIRAWSWKATATSLCLPACLLSSTSTLSSSTHYAYNAAFKCRLCLIRVWSWRATATSLCLPACLPSSTSTLSSPSLSACKAAFKCRLCLIRA